MTAPHSTGQGFEDYPLTRNEYITAMVHLYRGELQRSNSWRLRLDHTTNWAIVATMGLLSFAFGTPEHPHMILVLGIYSVVLVGCLYLFLLGVLFLVENVRPPETEHWAHIEEQDEMGDLDV